MRIIKINLHKYQKIVANFQNICKKDYCVQKNKIIENTYSINLI